MTRRKISDRERITDAVAAAYEVARAGLCIQAINSTYRTPKAVASQLREAIVAMNRDHSMRIDRIAYVLNRDRKTIRYHLEAADGGA